MKLLESLAVHNAMTIYVKPWNKIMITNLYFLYYNTTYWFYQGSTIGRTKFQKDAAAQQIALTAKRVKLHSKLFQFCFDLLKAESLNRFKHGGS